MIESIVQKYTAFIYPYSKSWLGGAVSIVAYALTFYSAWRLFFRELSGKKQRLVLISSLILLHTLFAIDWVFYIQHWGTHPFDSLIDLAIIDATLAARYFLKLTGALRVILATVYLLAALSFTTYFVLCDLFPVFVLIHWG